MTPADRFSVQNLLHLVATDARSMTSLELKLARRDAGLSLGQAQRLTGIWRVTLELMESDPEFLAATKSAEPETMDAILCRLNEIYGLTGDTP